MHKDETAEGVYKTGKKRIPSNQIEPTKTKKIKVENLMDFDDTVFKLPPVSRTVIYLFSLVINNSKI